MPTVVGAHVLTHACRARASVRYDARRRRHHGRRRSPGRCTHDAAESRHVCTPSAGLQRFLAASSTVQL
eukprot:COSAG03_NODE_159_length_11381_cov_85.480057_11_plen_69_part_00